MEMHVAEQTGALAQIRRQAESLPPALRDWLVKRLWARWFPRDLAAAGEFLADRLAGRPFYLYGAGSHSAALLKQWAGQPLRRQLRGFLDGAAKPGQTLAGLPVRPAAAALAGEPAPIVLSHHEFEDGMRDDLIALGAPETRIVPVYLDTDYGRKALAKLEPPALARARALVRDKPRVVFVSARPRRIIDANTAARLRRLGRWQLVQIKIDRSESDDESSCYDAAFDAHNGLAMCLSLLRALQPDLICAQEHYSSGNFLPMALALAFPDTPVVGEFYDFLALTFDDPYVLARESYWRERDVALALAAERWPGNRLAGVISKEDGPALAAFLDGAPALKHKPYVDASECADAGPRLRQPPRLVWAGAIASSTLSPRLFGDNQLIDVFRKLADLGFEVEAYASSPDEAALRAQYDDYLALAAETSFAIHPAVQRQRLVRRLAERFDFGLMLGIPKPGSQQGVSHQVTVSGKMFTYLAAGLPVIVGSYLAVMAGWVREYGLGLVVDADRIDALPELIAKADYAAMLRNVAAYRRRFNLARSLEDVARFFDEALSRKPA